MASYFRSDGWVKSAIGPAVPGAQIFVCNQPANIPTTLIPNPPSPLATIYSDPNGLVPIAQPIITDGFGHYSYYALAGVYTVIVYLNGILQQSYPDQSIGGLGTGGGTGLIAGSGISIVGSTISTALIAGTGISIVGSTISTALIAGPGISIVGSTISSTVTLPTTTLTAGAATSVAGGSGAPASVNLNLSTEGTVDWVASNQGPSSSLAAYESTTVYTWKTLGLSRGKFSIVALDSGDSVTQGPQINNQTNSPLHLTANAGDAARPFSANPNINCGFCAVQGSGHTGGGSAIRIWGAGASHTYKFYVYVNQPSVVTVTAHADDGTAPDVQLTATESNTGAIWSFTFTANIPTGSSVTVSAVITTNNGTFAGAGFQAVTVF